MEVSAFFRKRNPKHYSIEGIFHTLMDYLNVRNESAINKVEVPYFSTSKFSLLRNTRYAMGQQRAVNHITGDIHYVALGLVPDNTILTIHDCVTLETKRSFVKQMLIKKLWYDWPIKRVKYVTAISEKTKKEIIDHTGCSSDKVRVIPNFYDPVFTYHVNQFNADKPRILQIGTRDNKNLERLIPALENISCQLVIIGELSQRHKNLLKEYKIIHEVHVQITKAELLDQYIKSDMIAFVSTYEGFGMPIIEAQAVGRPVLTSKLEPMISVTGGAATLVDPFSIEEIRKGVLKIISDESFRNTIVSNGLENVQQFSIDAIASKYLDLYKEAASHA